MRQFSLIAGFVIVIGVARASAAPPPFPLPPAWVLAVSLLWVLYDFLFSYSLILVVVFTVCGVRVTTHLCGKKSGRNHRGG